MDEDICDELALLQDRLDPFPMEDSYAQLVERYSCSAPIACASVAQVCKGRFRGRPVALKVRRPNVEDLFASDLANIKLIARFARFLNLPGSGNMLEVVTETTPIVMGEVDFIGEARRATAFRRSLSDVPGIIVPRVLRASRSHIVMEYLPGTKITDVEALKAQGVDLEELSYRLMSCFLIQVLRNGYYHGDTHPGNVAVDRRGRIVWYDLGCAINMEGAQDHLADAMGAVVNKDSAGLVRALTDMQVIRPVGCKSLVRTTFERLFVYLEEEDLTDFHASMASEKVFASNDDRVFRFNANFVYLVRSLTMVEGICRILDPEFDFAEVFQRTRPLLQLQAFMQPMEVLRAALSSPQNLKSLSNTVVEQEEVIDATLLRVKELYVKQTNLQWILIMSMLVSALLAVS
jgi:predicted unusual protein kinase regulating ubiquinone biosynthesis (AarF/ABC1/UbiB family)